MASINHLPAELQYLFLDNCSAEALLSLRQCSKYWRNTINQREDVHISRLLKEELSTSTGFFERWQTKFDDPDLVLKFSIAAIFETELFEAGELEMGAYHKRYLPREYFETIPWDVPFLRPGLISIPFQRLIPTEEENVVRLDYSSYRRPDFGGDFGLRCLDAYSEIKRGGWAYVCFMLKFERRVRNAAQAAKERYGCETRPGPDRLYRYVLAEFVKCISWGVSLPFYEPLPHSRMPETCGVFKDFYEQDEPWEFYSFFDRRGIPTEMQQRWPFFTLPPLLPFPEDLLWDRLRVADCMYGKANIISSFYPDRDFEVSIEIPPDDGSWKSPLHFNIPDSESTLTARTIRGMNLFHELGHPVHNHLGRNIGGAASVSFLISQTQVRKARLANFYYEDYLQQIEAEPFGLRRGEMEMDIIQSLSQRIRTVDYSPPVMEQYDDENIIQTGLPDPIHIQNLDEARHYGPFGLASRDSTAYRIDFERRQPTEADELLLPWLFGDWERLSEYVLDFLAESRN